MLRRYIVPSLSLLLALPFTAHSASLSDYNLNATLRKVAKESSVGTPRAINEDILDQGFTAEGNELINHLSVRPEHAAKMRSNPDTVRVQLGMSVCKNTGFRQLMAKGAVLRYDFTEYKTNRPVDTQRFTAQDCGLKK